MGETLTVYETKTPAMEMEDGAKIANALMEVVRKAKLAKKFGGEKEHLYYEAWQALGKMNGSTVTTGFAEPVEIDGVKGAKAQATVVNTEGRVIGGAEAYCMRDEPNWKNKPWFQLASMAQTRAGSKAFRNLYAYVATLAGYAGTPAEEMDGVHPVEKESPKEHVTSTPNTPINDLRRNIAIMLLQMCGSEEAAQDKLQELTTWTDKENKTIMGKRTPAELKNEKNVQITHHKVKALFDEWKVNNAQSD